MSVAQQPYNENTLHRWNVRRKLRKLRKLSIISSDHSGPPSATEWSAEEPLTRMRTDRTPANDPNRHGAGMDAPKAVRRAMMLYCKIAPIAVHGAFVSCRDLGSPLPERTSACQQNLKHVMQMQDKALYITKLYSFNPHCMYKKH